MPVGVIPGFGGAPVGKVTSGAPPTLGVAKFNNPQLQAIFEAAMQHIMANPNATPAQDAAAGASLGLSGRGKGQSFANSPMDARNLEISAASMAAQAGTNLHHSPGLFSRVIDVLSRPMYTVASATQRAGEDLGTKGFGLHNLGAFAEGAGEGITGKNKEDFGKLLQEKVDIDKVKKDHPDWSNSQVLKEVQKNPGQGHNGLLTGIGGLGLDLVLDPTTYLGTGAVSKVLDAPSLIEHAAQAHRITDEAVRLGHIEDTPAARAGLLTSLGVNPSTGESMGLAGNLARGKYATKSQILTPAQKVASEQQALPFHAALNQAMDKHLSEIFKVHGWDQIKDPHLAAIAKQTVMDAMNEHPSLIKSLKSFTFHADQANPARTDKLLHEIHFSKALSTREGLQGLLDHLSKFKDRTGLEYTSTKANTPEELLRHIITHEIGHHAHNILPGFVDATKASLEGKTQEGLVRRLVQQFGTPEKMNEALSQHISGYAGNNIREALAEAWAGNKIVPEAMGPVAKNFHDLVDGHIASNDAKTAFSEELRKAAAGDKVDFADHLNTVLQKNLNPELSRAIQVKFAGIPLAHIPVERLARFVTDFTHGDNVIGKVTKKYEELFRSSKGVDPILHNLNLSAQGTAQEYNRHKLYTLRKIYNGTDAATRKRVIDAYRTGVKTLPVVGKDGTNILNHFNSEVQRIQGAVTNTQELHDIQRFLPSAYKLDEKELKGALNEKWLEDHIKHTLDVRRGTGGKPIKGLNDPGQILFQMDHALAKARAHQALWRSISHSFGHLARGRAPVAVNGKKAGTATAIRREVAALKSADGRAYKGAFYKSSHGRDIALPYTKGFVFHPDIAEGLEKFHTILHSPKTYQDGAYNIIQMMKPATQAFKSLVTKWNPGFHERNLIGEVMASTMAGVHDPKVYSQAATVLKHWGRTFEKPGMGVKDARAEQVIGDHVPLTGKTITLKKAYRLPNGLKTKEIPVDLVMDLYKRNGLRTGWYSEFDDALGTGNKLQKAGSFVNQKVQHGTEQVEDFARMAHFIDSLNKSDLSDLEKAAEQSALTVRKYHFDYTDFTPFEKNVMSTIFPFYKWTRKNIPMQIEMLLTHPGRVSAIPKAESALSRIMGYTNSQNSDTYLPGADAIVPDFLRLNGAFPVGTAPTGNTRYLDPAIPTVQGFTALQPGNLPVGGWLGKVPIPGLDTAATMASPFLKIPAELMTGRKLGGGLISDSNKYVASETPYTNLLYSLMNKKPGDPGTSGGKLDNTKLIQFLAGIGLQENTPAYMQSQAKRDQQVASAIRKAYEKKHGTFHSTNHPGVR